MKIAIYIRTSTEDQNPENQLKDCLSINNYGDYEVYQDKQSAFKDNKERENFNKLLDMIKSRKIEHIIVWDFDRIYRNRLKFKEFLALLKAYNVQLHSFRQDWLESLYNIPSPWNDIVSELMINIYGHIAEDESRRKSDRVKIAVRKKDGNTLSYKGNKWGRKSLSKNIINKVLDLNKQGKSIRQIAKEVTYNDKNNNSKNISVAGVHKILTKNKGGNN